MSSGFFDILGPARLASSPPAPVALSTLPYVNPPAGVITYIPTFKIQHESDLSGWDTVSAGVARATPGLASTAGKLRVTLSGTEARYATKAWTQENQYIHHRFYVDISGLSMTNGDSFVLHEIATDGTPAYLVRVNLGYADDAFKLTLQATDDSGVAYSNTPVILTQDEHWIEIGVQMATETSEDGAAIMYVDGYQTEVILGLDNYDVWANISEFRLGAVAGVDAGTSGYIDFDEVILLDENRSSYL